ncbi:hypothetical protein GCM10008937_32870 [Deinococcus depolymerans]|uniref:Secreted protein n=1 Tax=Deinococcus depolymerans TaxID=392408 RepID=A0ABN1CNL2_9DEIO
MSSVAPSAAAMGRVMGRLRVPLWRCLVVFNFTPFLCLQSKASRRVVRLTRPAPGRRAREGDTPRILPTGQAYPP